MPLLGRTVAIEFGTEGAPGVRFTGLRVGFQVKMSLSRTPNTATIRVWNLSAAAVAALQLPLAAVRLLVGYEIPRLVFQGNPIAHGVRAEKSGAERIITIDASDGGRAYGQGRVAVSFATPTTLEQVFAVVAAQLGLPIGFVEPLPPIQFPSGIVLHGTARDVLDRIASMAGANWTIRDGVLTVLLAGKATTEPAALFSDVLGNLIGSPQITDKGVQAVALLDAGMRPGRPFAIQSASVNGAYVARDVVFEGDSGYERPYYVKVTGRPPGA